MAIDNRACPICGGPVTQEEFVGHVNTGLQPHHHLYKAFCQSCQIKLERIITGKQDIGWFSSSVDEQNIVGKLSDEDVAQVEKILAKYPALLAKWQEFIVQKQETDQVCRFKEQDSPYTGLTIKRGNHLIGRFSILRNI